MKKYNVFDLYVIKNDDYYFICEKLVDETIYREIFTKEKINVLDKQNIEYLKDYYSLLSVVNYTTCEPLMLTKKELLIKYAEINSSYIEREKQYNSSYKKMIEEQDEYLKAFKELSEKNPEKAKQIAIESLKRTGILDQNEQIAYPYNFRTIDDMVLSKQTQSMRILKK